MVLLLRVQKHRFKFFGQAVLGKGGGASQNFFFGRKFLKIGRDFFCVLAMAKSYLNQYRSNKKYEKLRGFLVGMQEVSIFVKLAAPRADFHPPGFASN